MAEPETPANSDAAHTRLEDEPTGDAIRRGDSFRVGPEGMDLTTLELTEELCRRFQIDVGLVFVKLNFQDVRFQFAWLERRVMKGQLPDAE